LEEIRSSIKWNNRGHVGTFRRWIKYFNVICTKIGFPSLNNCSISLGLFMINKWTNLIICGLCRIILKVLIYFWVSSVAHVFDVLRGKFINCFGVPIKGNHF
jgi:hypothetical protein